jgi:hypothetical protein
MSLASGQGEYQNTDNTKIGIKRDNFYWKKIRGLLMKGTNTHTES